MFPDTPTSASSSPADAVMVANPPVRQGMRVRRATTIRLVSSDSLTPRACLVSLFFAAGVILVAIGSSMSFFEWNGQQAISFQGYNVIKDLGTVKGWLGSAVFTGCELRLVVPDTLPAAFAVSAFHSHGLLLLACPSWNS